MAERVEMPAARRVISLTERRLGDPAAVIANNRPPPTVDAYAELLTRRNAAQTAPAERAGVS